MSKFQKAIRTVPRASGTVSTALKRQKPTLYDHSKGKPVGNLKRSGVESSMTPEVEETLINYLKFMADRG